MKITAQEIAFYSPNSSILSRVKLQSTPSTPNSSQRFAALDKVSLSRESSSPEASLGVNIDEFASSITRNFWKADDASKNAGDHRDTFWQVSNSLKDEGELQIAYHEFAAGLSKKDLKHFLTALKTDPKNLSTIMKTAARLSDEALSPFLEAASLVEGDFDEFNQHVNQMLDQKGTSSSAFQYTYLSAAVKTDSQIMQFIEDTGKMSEGDLKKLTKFINSELPGDDRDNFIEFFSFANRKDLNTLIDVTTGLNGKDKKNLLAAASWAENYTQAFMEHIGKGKDITDFLAVAAHSGKKLGTFLQLADNLDLQAISSLSLVNTANFLDAAAKPNARIQKLTQVGAQLEGEDKSYFFYAAAHDKVNQNDLLTKVQELTGTELSDFLIQTANQDEAHPDQAVYMKGLLTEAEYNDFQNTAKEVPHDMLIDLVEMTNGFTGQLRSNFLKAGAASDQAAGEFISMLGNLSQEQQKSYLDVAMELDGERQKNFVQTSVKTKGQLSEFVQITKDLLKASTKILGSMRPLDSFLSVAQDANSQDLLDFIHLVGQLDETQKPGFLFTAQVTSLDLSELIQLGSSALSLETDRFNDIFNFHKFNHFQEKYNPTGNNLSSDDYKSLIGLAGQLDDIEWKHIQLIKNSYKISLSQLASIVEDSDFFGPEKYDYDFFKDIGISDGTVEIVV